MRDRDGCYAWQFANFRQCFVAHVGNHFAERRGQAEFDLDPAVAGYIDGFYDTHLAEAHGRRGCNAAGVFDFVQDAPYVLFGYANGEAHSAAVLYSSARNLWISGHLLVVLQGSGEGFCRRAWLNSSLEVACLMASMSRP